MSNSPQDPQAVEINPAGPAHPSDSFAETLQLFWIKNRNLVLGCVSAILLAIVGKGGYDLYREHAQKVTGEEYAAAGNTTEKLIAFAKAHEGHPLAGAASLRVADEAYSAGRYLEAQLAYDKALPALKDTPFLGRAKLGSAMSIVMQSKQGEAETALRALMGDSTQFKGVRSEAGYQLANLLVDMGKREDAAKVIDQMLLIDPTGAWSQRALMLRNELPAPAAGAAPAAEPAAQDLKLSVPGK